MEMVYMILLLTAYGVEPAAQYFLFSNIFELKASRKKSNIYFCWGLSYALLCIKQIVSMEQEGYELILFVAVILIYILSSSWLYVCKKYKIVIYICILLICALISECITFIFASLLGLSISTLDIQSIDGVIVTYLSKIIYIILCYLVYKMRNRKILVNITDMIEVLPFLIGVIAFEAPTVILFNNMQIITYNDKVLLLFASSQIVVLLIIIYFMYIVKKHKNIERSYELRLEKDAAKFETYEELDKLVQELRELRHDFKFHTSTLQQLFDEQRFDELGLYISQLRNNVKSAERYIVLDNKAVAGLLNQKVKEMEEKKISFEHIIEISNFVLEDTDMCSLLGNILENAITATNEALQKRVNLKITYEKDGYSIRCENTYATKPVFKHGEFMTTKADKKEHGYGIKIIRRIARAYSGMVKIDSDEEWFRVSIFIPYKGEAYD